MSFSMYSANRNTHVEVVVLGALSVVIVVIAGFTRRMSYPTTASTDRRIDTDKIITRVRVPAVVTNNAENTIR
jgi:hypothetical protein